jgi:hypothetical protein
MDESTAILNAIDFLPDRYRDAKIKRSAKVWRLLLAVVFCALLSMAGFYQQRMLWQAQAELANVEVMHAAAISMSKTLADEQAKVAEFEHEADLWTYMRHPWPRTQILNAVFSPLPESAQFNSFQLSFAKQEKPVVEGSKTLTEDPVDKTPSATRDLKRLRSEWDAGRWQVLLTGTTTDVAELHVYVAALESNKLFTNVDLLSIEAPSSPEQHHSRFILRLTLKPGYGQPGGPTISEVALNGSVARGGGVR